uniref:Uncharacterized protein n=1 Tax=Rhizophora mucronata TaxID=61149 RepID=A0A2P2IWM3_RHIMU
MAISNWSFALLCWCFLFLKAIFYHNHATTPDSFTVFFLLSHVPDSKCLSIIFSAN